LAFFFLDVRQLMDDDHLRNSSGTSLNSDDPDLAFGWLLPLAREMVVCVPARERDRSRLM
jgi:hypothetical protein